MVCDIHPIRNLLLVDYLYKNYGPVGIRIRAQGSGGPGAIQATLLVLKVKDISGTCHSTIAGIAGRSAGSRRRSGSGIGQVVARAGAGGRGMVVAADIGGPRPLRECPVKGL